MKCHEIELRGHALTSHDAISYQTTFSIDIATNATDKHFYCCCCCCILILVLSAILAPCGPLHTEILTGPEREQQDPHVETRSRVFVQELLPST